MRRFEVFHRAAWMALAAAGLAFAPPVLAQVPYYQLDLVGSPGFQALRGERLTGARREVSVNENGVVAFVARYELGSAVVAIEPGSGLKSLSFPDDQPGETDPELLTDYQFPVINAQGKVAARRSRGGTSQIRVLDADAPGDVSIFDPVGTDIFALPAWGNDGTLGVVRRTGSGAGAVVQLADATAEPFETVVTPLTGLLRPVAASGRVFVVRCGTASDGTLSHYKRAAANSFTATALAATGAGGWTALGDSPGVSADGDLVAFSGARAEGAASRSGIYLSVLNAGTPGYDAPVRLIDDDTVLAYDAAAAPITMASFDLNNRVGVARFPGGAAGLAGDRAVVVFIATPSKASRENAGVAGRPLLFGAGKGIWTVEVEFDKELKGAKIIAHTSPPVLVAQVGGTLFGGVVSDLALYDPIAAAEEAEGFGLLSEGLSDHYLAFWAQTNRGEYVVRAARIDSDADGLPDHWENAGIDMDGDGTIDLDLPGMGADPGRRDLFLQVNWLPPRTAGAPHNWSHALPPGAADCLANFFRDAPVENIDGSRGITLHLDAGPGNDAAGQPFSRNLGSGTSYGGELRPAERPDIIYFGKPGLVNRPGLKAGAVDALHNLGFGERDRGAREVVFRRCLVGDLFNYEAVAGGADRGNAKVRTVISATATRIRTADDAAGFVGQVAVIIQGRGAGQMRRVDATDPAAPQVFTVQQAWNPAPDATSRLVLVGTSSGRAEAGFRVDPDNSSIAGNDFIMTLGGWGVRGSVNPGGWIGNARLQASTILHEMGHTMGLLHGGTDHCQFKGLAHLSIMSYTHQTRTSPTSWFRVGRGPEPPQCYEKDDILAMLPGMRYDPVFNYSDGSDPLGLNEWARLRLGPSSHGPHLGNTFGRTGLSGAAADADASENPDPIPLDEPEVEDYEPLDLEPPVVAIMSPPPGAAVGAGGGFEVRVAASDDREVAAVRVALDIDGDGEIGAGERFPAQPVGGGEYVADVQGAAAVAGMRALRAEAEDYGMNLGVAEAPVDVALLVQSGTFPAAPAGAARATAAFGPVLVPAAGTLTFVVEATPGGGAADAAATSITFGGQVRQLVSQCQGAAASVCTATWSAPGPGALSGVVSGIVPAGGGARPAQNYTLKVLFQGDVVPPAVELAEPRARYFLGGAPSVAVRAVDDGGVASVVVRLDLNGDGDTADAGESAAAAPAGGGLFVATFPPLGGVPGRRPVAATARDGTGNESAVAAIALVLDDAGAPEVAITFPGGGGAVSVGGVLEVELSAADDRGLESVSVAFDIDGDGSVSGLGETVAAAPLGGAAYRAVFADVAGGPGLREIVATVRDVAGKQASASQGVSVSAGGTGAQTLLTTGGTIPAQPGQFSGGRRQSVPFGPLTVPARGTVTFTVTSTPPVRREVQNIPREDSAVRYITFGGEAQPRMAMTCNAFGADPAICTTRFESPSAGELAGEILGPGAWNIFGEFVGHAAQDYALVVTFEPIDPAPPAVEFTAPAAGAAQSIGAGLTVDLSVRDPSGVASVVVRFDRNGDGDSADAGEQVAATAQGGAAYRTVFGAITGPPGARVIAAEAADPFGNAVVAETFVSVGGSVGGGRQTLLIYSGDIAAQSSAFSGGERQTRGFPSVQVPGAGRLYLEVTASPPVRREVQNIPRYDTAVQRIRFDGQPLTLSPQCNAFGADPSVCTSVWDPPRAGLLGGELLGPATYNVFDEFTGHGAQSYTLKITYEGGPGVSEVEPSAGSAGGRTPVTVRGGGFEDNAVVLFGDVAAADVVRVSGTELTCLTPPGLPGPVPVTVINPDPDNLPFNFGGPYGVFGTLDAAFSYAVPPPPGDPLAERWVATYTGRFPEKAITELQESAQLGFTVPGSGGLRFEAWAFVPVLGAIPGPANDPTDLEYHNDSTAVPWFVAANGVTYFMDPECTPLDFAYGPVICESVRLNVPRAAAGNARMLVRGPAKWSARWKELEVCELLGAPAQSWAVAVFHTPDEAGAEPGTFAAFQQENFTAAELADPDISGAAADPDGDGFPNAAEHVLGGNPKRTEGDLLVTGKRGGVGGIEFTVRDGLVGVRAAVEASPDLARWQEYYAFTEDPGFASALVLEAAPVAGGTRLFVRVPGTPGSPLFYRIRVGEP